MSYRGRFSGGPLFAKHPSRHVQSGLRLAHVDCGLGLLCFHHAPELNQWGNHLHQNQLWPRHRQCEGIFCQWRSASLSPIYKIAVIPAKAGMTTQNYFFRSAQKSSCNFAASSSSIGPTISVGRCPASKIMWQGKSRVGFSS